MSLEVPDLQALGAGDRYVLPTKEEVLTAFNDKNLDELRRVGKVLKDAVAALKGFLKNGPNIIDEEAKNALEKLNAELTKEITTIIKAQKAKEAPKPKATPAPKAAAASAAGSSSSSAAAEDDKQKIVRTGEEIDATREDNFGEWYTQCVTRSEMIEYYDISGCYILRPWAYQIWEEVKSYLDSRFKKSGVKNCYFPLLVSERALMKEEENFDDFCPEVAWVTRSGQSQLDEPVAIRPTSETVMYPAFAKWIRSYRDLPLRLNQWCNIVRWEFKDAVPFIRSREFLWQEGHSAFASQEEADKEVLEILEYYRSAYEDLLAVPVTRGRKTEREKFAGAAYTTTVEAFIEGSGKAVQAATSHCLGTSFSAAKYFDINYEDEKSATQYVIQNSWGFTTRSLGVMIMVHGDNKGLVLPPRVAPIQVVVIPLIFKGKSNEDVNKKAKEIVDSLNAQGVRAELDDRVGYTPLRKFTHWEVRGVPIRIEIGPKDLENGVVTVCRRDVNYGKGDKKPTIAIGDNTTNDLKNLLDEIHDNMLRKARETYDRHTVKINTWDEFLPALNQKNLCLVPFCGEKACENAIKDRSAKESIDLKEQEEARTGAASSLPVGAAKSLCIPFDQPDLPSGTVCFGCEKHATSWTLFGRSY